MFILKRLQQASIALLRVLGLSGTPMASGRHLHSHPSTHCNCPSLTVREEGNKKKKFLSQFSSTRVGWNHCDNKNRFNWLTSYNKVFHPGLLGNLEKKIFSVEDYTFKISKIYFIRIIYRYFFNPFTLCRHELFVVFFFFSKNCWKSIEKCFKSVSFKILCESFLGISVPVLYIFSNFFKIRTFFFLSILMTILTIRHMPI